MKSEGAGSPPPEPPEPLLLDDEDEDPVVVAWIPGLPHAAASARSGVKAKGRVLT